MNLRNRPLPHVQQCQLLMNSVALRVLYPQKILMYPERHPELNLRELRLLFSRRMLRL